MKRAGLIFSLMLAGAFAIKAQFTTVSITTTPTTCNGTCDGTATATPQDGVGPYDYLWAPIPQTTQTATGLC